MRLTVFCTWLSGPDTISMNTIQCHQHKHDHHHHTLVPHRKAPTPQHPGHFRAHINLSRQEFLLDGQSLQELQITHNPGHCFNQQFLPPTPHKVPRMAVSKGFLRVSCPQGFATDLQLKDQSQVVCHKVFHNVSKAYKTSPPHAFHILCTNFTPNCKQENSKALQTNFTWTGSQFPKPAGPNPNRAIGGFRSVSKSRCDVMMQDANLLGFGLYNLDSTTTLHRKINFGKVCVHLFRHFIRADYGSTKFDR